MREVRDVVMIAKTLFKSTFNATWDDSDNVCCKPVICKWCTNSAERFCLFSYFVILPENMIHVFMII